MAPKNFEELEKMLEFSVNLNKPTVIRYPRGGEGKIEFKQCDEIDLGKAELVKKGNNLTIVAIGKMVERAMEVSEELEKDGISAEVINARFLKPLDKNTIIKSIEKTKNVITLEDGLLKGGLASAVLEAINQYNLKEVNVKTFGYDDCFVKHGKVEELEEKYGLSKEKIVNKLKKEIKALK